MPQGAEARTVNRFRKARYAVAVLAISFGAIAFAPRIGDHSTRYVVSVYLLFAGGIAVVALLAWMEDAVEWWF